MTYRSLGLVLVWSLMGCHSGPQIRASGDVIKTDIERARRSNALRCAPRELASAEANLDFALGELDEGNSQRAYEHIVEAELMAKKAVALSRDCAPRQVVVKEAPPLVVKIEETDKDGDTVLDKDDQCPSLPGPVSNKGCPIEAPKDRDGDGILDPSDKCIDQPEDMDAFQDEDGCPEPDNDNDGILDTSDKCPNEAGPMQNMGCPILDKDGDGLNDDKDKCPNEPEDKDGFQDDDGCPDLDNDSDGVPDDRDDCPMDPGPVDNKGCPRKYSLVAVTKDRIEIKKQIKFATGSAKIVGAESEKILDEVALALKDNAQIKKVRVEGHTDSVGDDSKNLKLSQNRANSVMSALIKRGVDPARMEAVGFGETKPIASNSTSAGKAENRRTEFNIADQ
ncbi:MAG: OmpA family protein [Archangium sp.]|nr:OmpA family protein [Archangium sp.]MDP3151166.1 OmpA family protein [Archangium sp.]MDP3570193.1 OmpA family protein [Archangium sp.]